MSKLCCCVFYGLSSRDKRTHLKTAVHELVQMEWDTGQKVDRRNEIRIFMSENASGASSVSNDVSGLNGLNSAQWVVTVWNRRIHFKDM